MNIVPDTSVVVDGRVSEEIRDGEFDSPEVVVPDAVVSELEAQANDGRQIGWDGLEELKTLAELADAGEIELRYAGDRPTEAAIQRASAGAIDAIIRQVAVDTDATFLTSDIVQSEIATAKGLDARYLEPREHEPDTLAIEALFDDTTMSVHLRAGMPPMAKRGSIGDIRFEQIGDEVLEEGDLRTHATDIMSAVKSADEGFVEIDEHGMQIVQYHDYRIALAEPPFSDGAEITAVRPTVKTTMDDYDYAGEITDRLLERNRGVLVAGSPGAGKSTLAQAIAGVLAEEAYVVKTMEKPRDLDVNEAVTQYTALGGEMETTADSLLMVRPDYTIYDEVRKTDDFEVFSDMRLAGVGMVGVVHATRAIDALQRLVGRVELGMIPQVVDTVVFLEAGQVETLYDVETEVKVPAGLQEADLARPVILITDHETGTPAYEIYTFNRQVVTVPLDEAGDDGRESGMNQLAAEEIRREIQSMTSGRVEVDVRGPNTAVIYVSSDEISHVIGKGGGRISDVENRLGVSIDVRTHEERSDSTAGSTESGGGVGERASGSQSSSSTGGVGAAGSSSRNTVVPEITGRHIVIPVEDGQAGNTVEVRADGEYLFTATVGRGGEIQVSRGSAIADDLERAIDRQQPITILAS